MIPFEADPMSYCFCIFFFIVFIALVTLSTLSRFASPDASTLCFILSTICIIASLVAGVIIYTGSTQQIDITVCNHITDDDYMYIVDENDQTYFISHPSLKLKIRDGEKIKATVLNEWGYGCPKIYKIDTSFVCNVSEEC